MKIGVVEIVIALLFLIPGMGFPAALLLTAYLGGATATHVRVGDPFYFPIIIGVVIWIALGLRRPEVVSLVLGTKNQILQRNLQLLLSDIWPVWGGANVVVNS